MGDLLQLLLGFPLAVFTGLLALVLIYWLLVILGALDVEVLDLRGVDEVFDGMLDAAGIEGGVEGGVEGGGIDGGSAEGGEAAQSGPRSVAGVLDALGLSGVPLTISLSAVTFYAWLLTLLGMLALRALLPSMAGEPLLGGLVAALAFALALVVAGWTVVRPLRPAFVTAQAPRRHEAVGRACTILSARVDQRTGRAEIEDGGAGLLAEVRCFEPNQLTRGSRAVVFHYDRAAELYHVVPADPLLEPAGGPPPGGRQGDVR
jgi:hypothetical protein